MKSGPDVVCTCLYRGVLRVVNGMWQSSNKPRRIKFTCIDFAGIYHPPMSFCERLYKRTVPPVGTTHLLFNYMHSAIMTIVVVIVMEG